MTNPRHIFIFHALLIGRIWGSGRTLTMYCLEQPEPCNLFRITDQRDGYEFERERLTEIARRP